MLCKQILPILGSVLSIGIDDGSIGQRCSCAGKLAVCETIRQFVGINRQAQIVRKLINRFTLGRSIKIERNNDLADFFSVQSIPKILQHGGDFRESKIYKRIDDVIRKQLFAQQLHHILTELHIGEHGGIVVAQLDEGRENGHHILAAQEGIELRYQVVYHLVGNGIGIVFYGVVAAAEVAGIRQTHHVGLGLREFVARRGVAVVGIIIMLLRPVGQTAAVHKGLHLVEQAAVFQLIVGFLHGIVAAELRDDPGVDQIQLLIGKIAGQVAVGSRGGLLKHVAAVLELIEHVYAGLHVVFVIRGVLKDREPVQHALQRRFDDREIAQRDGNVAVAVAGGVHCVRDTGLHHIGKLRIQTVDIILHVLVEAAEQGEEVRARQRIAVERIRVGSIMGIIILIIYIYIVVRIALRITEIFGCDRRVAVVGIHHLVALAIQEGISVNLFIDRLILEHMVLKLVQRKAAQIHIDQRRKVRNKGGELQHKAAALRLVAEIIAHRLDIGDIGILVEVRVAEHVEFQLAGIRIVGRKRGNVAAEQTVKDVDLRVGYIGCGLRIVIAEFITALKQVHVIRGGDLIIGDVVINDLLELNEIVILVVILEQRKKVHHVGMVIAVYAIQLFQALGGGVIRYVAVHVAVNDLDEIKIGTDAGPDGLRLQLGHVIKIKGLFDFIRRRVAVEIQPVAVQRMFAACKRILPDVFSVGLALVVLQSVLTGVLITIHSVGKRFAVRLTRYGGVLSAKMVDNIDVRLI